MRGNLTLQDLEGENALVIVGTVGRLLRQLDRENGTNLREEYEKKAMSGDYDHLWDTTVEYADQWLALTLSVGQYSKKERCWYCDGEGVSPDEDDPHLEPCPECHGSRVSS